MTPKRASCFFVRPNIFINRLMRDPQQALFPQPSRDLFWAPLLTDIMPDQSVIGIAEVSISSGTGASTVGFLLGFTWSVHSETAQISSKFSGNGGAMALHLSSNLSHTKSLFS